jgi:hypothetical protein
MNTYSFIEFIPNFMNTLYKGFFKQKMSSLSYVSVDIVAVQHALVSSYFIIFIERINKIVCSIDGSRLKEEGRRQYLHRVIFGVDACFCLPYSWDVSSVNFIRT